MAGRIARHELAFRDDARASFPERLEDAACELRADALPGKLRRHLGVEKNDAAALGLVVGDRERVSPIAISNRCCEGLSTTSAMARLRLDSGVHPSSL